MQPKRYQWKESGDYWITSGNPWLPSSLATWLHTRLYMTLSPPQSWEVKQGRRPSYSSPKNSSQLLSSLLENRLKVGFRPLCTLHLAENNEFLEMELDSVSAESPWRPIPGIAPWQWFDSSSLTTFTTVRICLPISLLDVPHTTANRTLKPQSKSLLPTVFTLILYAPNRRLHELRHAVLINHSWFFSLANQHRLFQKPKVSLQWLWFLVNDSWFFSPKWLESADWFFPFPSFPWMHCCVTVSCRIHIGHRILKGSF